MDNPCPLPQHFLTYLQVIAAYNFVVASREEQTIVHTDAGNDTFVVVQLPILHCSLHTVSVWSGSYSTPC